MFSHEMRLPGVSLFLWTCRVLIFRFWALICGEGVSYWLIAGICMYTVRCGRCTKVDILLFRHQGAIFLGSFSYRLYENNYITTWWKRSGAKKCYLIWFINNKNLNYKDLTTKTARCFGYLKPFLEIYRAVEKSRNLEKCLWVCWWTYAHIGNSNNNACVVSYIFPFLCNLLCTSSAEVCYRTKYAGSKTKGQNMLGQNSSARKTASRQNMAEEKTNRDEMFTCSRIVQNLHWDTMYDIH
jgi:hypothetical protein